MSLGDEVPSSYRRHMIKNRGSSVMIPYSQNIDGQLLDCGKRIADVLNQKIADHGWWEIRNKFMAFSIRDGSSDNVLYDRKQDAVRHQHNNEQHYWFVCFRGLGNGASMRDCAIMVKFARDVYRAGYRFPDPDRRDGGLQPAMTTRWNDFYRGRLSRLTTVTKQREFWLPGGFN